MHVFVKVMVVNENTITTFEFLNVSRRELLDISPVLTEAASAIIDVSNVSFIWIESLLGFKLMLYL